MRELFLDNPIFYLLIHILLLSGHLALGILGSKREKEIYWVSLVALAILSFQFSNHCTLTSASVLIINTAVIGMIIYPLIMFSVLYNRAFFSENGANSVVWKIAFFGALATAVFVYLGIFVFHL